MDEIEFRVLNVDIPDTDILFLFDSALSGKDIGLLTEAGCPCVAVGKRPAVFLLGR